MIFVTGRSKRAIEDHFDMAYELETELEAAGKHALLEIVRSVQPDDMQCVYVRQSRALGLGHAVLCAEHLVGDEPFAVLLADDLMRGKAGGPGVLKQMAEVFARTQSSVLAVQDVPLEHVHRYGVVAGTDIGNRLVDIQQMVEKPKAEVAPSRTTVAGRYILTPAVFERIRAGGRGVQGEIQLTDGIAGLLATEKVLAYAYEGKRFDCGSKVGFLQASVELALENLEVGAEFRDYLKQLNIASFNVA
jgi:UTP--glucose-1-phosphate uridylyltransferase